MTNDPALHALADLCQALGHHPSPEIHGDEVERRFISIARARLDHDLFRSIMEESLQRDGDDSA